MIRSVTSPGSRKKSLAKERTAMFATGKREMARGARVVRRPSIWKCVRGCRLLGEGWGEGC